MTDLLSFSHDLSKLYSKTKSQGVENCFIRVAQAYEDELEKWIKGPEPLKQNLDGSVLKTFKYLFQLKEQYPAGMGTKEIFEELTGKNKALAFFAIGLRDFLDSNIVSIFSDILSNPAWERFKPTQDDVNLETIGDELTSLHRSFQRHQEQMISGVSSSPHPATHKEKPTKRASLTALFSYLLKRFSADISSAFSGLGQEGISTMLQSGKLANPEAMANALDLPYDPSFVKGVGSDLLKDITKMNILNHDQIYNHVRNEIMVYAGEVGREATQNSEQQMTEEYDFSDFMGEEEYMFEITSPEVKELELDAAQITNSIVVMATSYTLNELFQYTSNYAPRLR